MFYCIQTVITEFEMVEGVKPLLPKCESVSDHT